MVSYCLKIWDKLKLNPWGTTLSPFHYRFCVQNGLHVSQPKLLKPIVHFCLVLVSKPQEPSLCVCTLGSFQRFMDFSKQFNGPSVSGGCDEMWSPVSFMQYAVVSVSTRSVA